MSVSRKDKIEAAQFLLKEMPESLKQSMLDTQCSIPLPMYDGDGVFKSYL